MMSKVKGFHCSSYKQSCCLRGAARGTKPAAGGPDEVHERASLWSTVLSEGPSFLFFFLLLISLYFFTRSSKPVLFRARGRSAD